MQPPASTGSRQLEDHLVSPAFVRDPYPALAHLRETDPVYWSDSIGGWLLTRYDDVVTGFKDVPAFSNEGRLGKAAEHLPARQRSGPASKRTTAPRACCTPIRPITRACGASSCGRSPRG